MTQSIEKTIDSIQRVRARNNTAWMNLVRLAVKKAPKEARAIFLEITSNDEKILSLSKRLAGGKHGER